MTLFLVSALYLVILVWASWGYLRHRDPLLRDVMLIFACVGMLLLLGLARLVTREPPEVVISLFAVLLVGQPFFTLRLVSRLRRVPAWMIRAALVGWVAGSLPVMFLERPLPKTVVWPLVVYCFGVESVAAWLLVREALRRNGAARVRLECAAAGTALFGTALLLSGAGRPLAVAARWSAVVSALIYMLAFLPPRWLRRTWSWGAAYALMRRLLTAPADEPAVQTWRTYCQAAQEVLGADDVVVLLPGPGDAVTAVTSAGPLPIADRFGAAEVDRLLGAETTIDAHRPAGATPPLAVTLAQARDTRFVTSVSLTFGGRRGALVLLSRFRVLFAEDDLSLFAELSSQAAFLAERSEVLTERQRAESMFRGLLEAAPDAIVGVTADGRITLINAQAERLFGYDRAELLGRPVEILVPEVQRGPHSSHRRHYFAHPKSRPMGARMALAAVRKDGTEFPAEISLSSLETDDGTIVSAAVRDVTERVEAQAERERLAAQAERDAAERRMQHTRRLESLGQLAGGVAHDFNNILAVIANYAELITETLDTATPSPEDLTATRNDLAQISRAAERAGRLTKQLLAFGRRDITQAAVIDLNQVITDVEQMLRRSIGEHIHLMTRVDPDLWPVFADPSQIEQIMVNLAVNARDAMPTGGTLSIDTANTDLDLDDVAGSPLQPGRHVRVRISDTGTGMPPDVAERAFEPFYTTKPAGSGTGLGLATVYGIARSAGGHVRLYSEPGFGTTVTIVLPATSAAAVSAEPAGTDTTAGPAVTSAPRETVLLVEDEQSLRDATSRILARAGYEVLAAGGGEEALRLVRAHPEPIHLLLTDVMMPEMLGNEVAARVQRLRPGIPVLYMSGYAQPVLAEHGTLTPGVTMIEKPFTRRDLLDRVHAVLHHATATTTPT